MGFLLDISAAKVTSARKQPTSDLPSKAHGQRLTENSMPCRPPIKAECSADLNFLNAQLPSDAVQPPDMVAECRAIHDDKEFTTLISLSDSVMEDTVNDSMLSPPLSRLIFCGPAIELSSCYLLGWRIENRMCPQSRLANPIIPNIANRGIIYWFWRQFYHY